MINNLHKFKYKSFLSGNIILINADCEAVMAEIGDKEIDLVLTDPPYGNYKIKDNKTCHMFVNLEPDKKIFQHLIRISKNQIIWGANFFKNFNLNGGMIIWNKLGVDCSRRKQAPTMSEAEIAYHSFNSMVKIFSYAWIGNVTGNNYQINSPEFKERIHPTQKPVPLISWCLNNYSKENDLIFDAFAGSFTTAIACIRTKRRFIGCELDPVYFEKAVERVETELKQLTLF